jgi:hypothetical protein
MTSRWALATGGEVHAAHVLDVDGEPWIVALAGTVLQAADGTGRRRWSLPRRVVTRIIALGDLMGTGGAQVLVRGTQRELALLDARTGTPTWGWSSADGTFVNEAGAVLLLPLARGHRLLVAPIYGTSIEAFDLVGPASPRHVWTLDGAWDAGFGPSLIAADMDGTGVARLVLSSRRGVVDRTRQGRHTTAETVLGKRHGMLYQAVVDVADGTILRDVAWAPNPRGHRCARPYGLLTAVPFEPGGRPGIVMGCCQVEEYLAVTRQQPDGSLTRGWSRFVEKDWPRDRQELRVHPDSVRDLRGEGRPELVSSLWDGRRWRTSVQDLATGRDRAGDRLEDRVLWGALERAEGTTCLVVGEARQRPVGGPSVLELVDGASLEVIDRRPGAEVLIGGPDRLPNHVAYMAHRRGLVRFHSADGEAAVIRSRRGALEAWWPDAAGDVHTERIGGAGDIAVHGAPGWALVTSRSGYVRRLGPPFGEAHPRRGIRTAGRVSPIVATRAPHGVAVGVELPGSRTELRGRAGDDASSRVMRLAGGQLSLRLADDGSVLARALTHGVVAPQVLRITSGGGSVLVEVTLDAPLDRPLQWMADGSMLLTLRTGTHTLATELREADGRLRWRLDAGAYLHAPAAAVVDGTPLVVLDDHGVLHLVDASAVIRDGSLPRPVVRWTRDWTAAYSQPIIGPFLGDGRAAILRANGIHGAELLDLGGRRRWRTEAPLWRYATGDAVVARGRGGWTLVAGRRDGRLDGIDVRDGRVAWSTPVTDALDEVALAVADLDGDGEDSVLVGLPDGRLMALDDPGRAPSIRWMWRMGAGVATIRAVRSRDDAAQPVTLVIATVDGRVRVLDLATGHSPRSHVWFGP